MILKPTYIKDISASLVVFLVALPLCMGIALASGAPPAAGLLTGIIGGIVVGFLAGAPLQVSGPAAGLSVIVFEIIRDQGFAALGPILILAGAMQLLAGALKAGRWFRAISPAVIHGMLAGIGLLIVLQQFHVMIDSKPKGTGMANAKAVWPAITQGIFPIDGSREESAIMLALLVIGIMVLWQRYRPEKLKLIPGALLGIVAASTVARFMHLELNFVEVPTNLLTAVHLPTLATFTGINSSIVGAAATIAFIASAETLLCASAVDKMQSIVKTNYDRELMAQGVGNLLCGAVGAIPMTGVIVRSSANVQAGATSRISAILHGVWILAIIVLFPGILRMVPVCALAGVLVFTGFNLIKVKDIRHLAKFGRIPLLIYAATLIVIVTTDLLTGVLTGVVLSLAKLIHRATHLRIYTEPHNAPTTFQPHPANSLDLYIEGSATFLRIPIITAALDAIPDGSTVYMRTDRLTYVDHACLDLLQDWIKNSDRNQLNIIVDRESLERKYWETSPVEPKTLTAKQNDVKAFS